MATSPEHSNIQEPAPRIGEGFQAQDRETIKDTLDHLLPHLQGEYCLSGGVATQSHLARAGQATTNRRLNDLDIVMRKLTDISPTITQDFLIVHWHPQVEVDGFYTAIVDSRTGLKIDVFGWDRFPPAPVLAQMGKTTVTMRSASDMLVVLLSASFKKAVNNQPLIRKQFTDAAALMGIADSTSTERLWRKLHQNIGITATEAWRNVQGYAAAHEDNFIEKLHGSAQVNCGECVNTTTYPIASAEAISAAFAARI